MTAARCRHGHDSETDDFCDECGVPIAGSSGPAGPVGTPDPEPDERCPRCGSPRTGRFCEEDGHDFLVSGSAAPAPAPPPNGAWVAAVEADRRYYESVVAREGPDIAEVTFPNYYPRAEIPLDGDEVRIGRRRVNGSTPPPQVDLAGPPLDPGVSHLHAVLLPAADGSGWSVLDPGSTNGTTINYGDDPIAIDTRVPLRPGDRVHVGAFTTIVVEQRPI
ncbi:FHA domain-containing protein [Actinomycetospora atypica]|uniref:FHA domain-containing protein n=1 Tax=Actinomycetospora atypica TaxID=1290095 RepID=A0ABV9YKE0_9PSEU